jgi:hypothetical protein
MVKCKSRHLDFLIAREQLVDYYFAIKLTAVSKYMIGIDRHLTKPFMFPQETKLEELYTIYCRTKPKSDYFVLPYKESFFKVSMNK